MPGAMRARQDIVGLCGIVLVGSCTVKVDNRPAVKKGDIVLPHFPFKGRHKIPSPIISGACQVLVDGQSMVRQGDFSACGDPVVTGSCGVQVGTLTTVVKIGEETEPGVVKVEDRQVYTNTPEGIQALIRYENSVSSGSLPGYHEESDGQAPVPANQQTQEQPILPAQIPQGGCTNSKYYKLVDSKMPIEAQRGLSKEQIECNWVALCTNILDRLRDDGFKFTINSGFRTLAYENTLGGSGNSDHNIGCAVDISIGNIEANKQVFKHMLNNYPYSQLIYEGNWVHIAYNGRGPKGNAKVMYTYNGRNPIVAGVNGGSLPQDLRA